jgi:hypothetical protein
VGAVVGGFSEIGGSLGERESEVASWTNGGWLVIMPHVSAIDCAVSLKSPVTMKIRIPARRRVATTSGISSL